MTLGILLKYLWVVLISKYIQGWDINLNYDFSIKLEFILMYKIEIVKINH